MGQVSWADLSVSFLGFSFPPAWALPYPHFSCLIVGRQPTTYSDLPTYRHQATIFTYIT